MIEKTFRHPALWFFATLFWISTVWYFSSQPGGTAPEWTQWNLRHSDKILHYICFSGGGFLVAGFVVSLGDQQINWLRVLRITVLATALLGWLDEWHQCHVPSRSGADPWDWLADIFGGATGALMIMLLFRLQKAYSKSLPPEE